MPGTPDKAATVLKELENSLSDLYGKSEAIAIARLAFTQVTGISRLDLARDPDLRLGRRHRNSIARVGEELLAGVPVQYATGEAIFCGIPFLVNGHVLIPRPETEELVLWITEVLGEDFEGKILDIGTGSGCIAIALAPKLPDSEITGIDISEAAVDIAKKNASAHDTQIQFHQIDILDKKDRNHLSSFDIIVSNPPYVRESERALMKNNVLLHEPKGALFVSDHDPLLFYRNILDFATLHLEQKGQLFFEINEAMPGNLKSLLDNYSVSDYTFKKDLNGKYRFLHARL